MRTMFTISRRIGVGLFCAGMAAAIPERATAVIMRAPERISRTESLFYAHSMTMDAQTNTYLTGRQFTNAVTIKLDAEGNPIWTARFFGGYHQGMSIALDEQTNVYVAGRDGSGLFFTARYSPAGVQDWLVNTRTGMAEKVVVSGGADPYIYVGGVYRYSNTGTIGVIRYDTSGNEVWFREHLNYGHSWESPPDMALDGDGNLYVASYHNVSGGSAGLLLKYAPDGTLLKEIQYNAPGHTADRFSHITLDADTNVILTGTTTMKFDSEGNPLWAAAGTNGKAVTVGPSNAVWIAGDYQLTKYDANGIMEWTQPTDCRFIFNNNGNERGMAVDDRGQAVITGIAFKSGGGLLVQWFTADGTHRWRSLYPATGGTANWGVCVRLDSRRNTYVAAKLNQAGMGDHSALVYYPVDFFQMDLAANTTLATPGETVYFTNTMVSGERELSGLEVVLPLPTGAVYAGGGTFTGSNVTWSFPAMPVNTQTNLTFQFLVDPAIEAEARLSVMARADSSSLPGTETSTVIEVQALMPGLGAGQDIPYASDPVHPGLGNYVLVKPLCALPANNLPVYFQAFYNSKGASRLGPLGYGWSHSYNIQVVVTGDLAIVRWGDGREDLYQRGTNGVFSAADPANRIQLTTNFSQYVVIRPDGRRYLFDASGYLNYITDLNNKNLVFTQNGSGPKLLTEMRDVAYRSITFTYTNGVLTNILLATPINLSVTLQYDAQTNLVALRDLRGHQWRFAYDDQHRLVSETDPRGVQVNSNAYDAAGRVIRQTDARGAITAFRYFTNGTDGLYGVEITTPDGGHSFQYYDSDFRIRRLVDADGHAVESQYDSRGRRAGASDKLGQNRTFRYDADGNATTLVDRAGAVVRATYGPTNRLVQLQNELGHTWSYGYDAKGNPVSTTDPLGSTLCGSFNSSGVRTNLTDPRGNTWRLTYNGNNQLTRVTDPLGGVVNYQYDALGRACAVSQPGNTNAVVRLGFDPLGNLTNLTDSLGYQTVNQYDAAGNRISQEFVPRGVWTFYEYDGNGRLTNLVDALGGRHTYMFDAMGRLLRKTDPDGVSMTYTYNRAGQRVTATDTAGRTRVFSYDANGNLATVSNPAGQTWHYTYDSEGRLVQSANPLGDARRTRYDAAGRVIGLTDESGRAQTFEYDAAGRLTAHIAPDGGTRRFEYDANGNLTRLTDTMGHAWEFSYNALNRCTTNRNPAGAEERILYDARGFPTQSTLRDGRIIQCGYDLNGRLAWKLLPDGAGLITNAYDAAGNRIRVADAAATNTMAYDLLNRRTAFTNQWGQAMQYEYTPAGRPARFIYPGNHAVSNQYDAAGRLTGIRDWAGHATVIAYDTAGRMNRIELPNGARTLIEHDAADRMLTLRHERADGSLIVQYDYAYDPAGRIIRRTRATATTVPPALVAGFAPSVYDSVNRLLTQTANAITNQWAFDARGSVTNARVAGLETRFQYDAQLRLLAVSNALEYAQYAYDACGNRVCVITNGVETRYLNDDGRIYTRWKDGATPRHFIYTGALLYSLDEDGQMRVYHADERGSVAAISDAAGDVVQTYDYDPDGRVVAAAGALDNEFQYLGTHGVTAEAAGLYLMRTRFYDPRAGRFLREDDLGLAAGPNLYAYANGDPMNLIDPSGQEVPFMYQLEPYGGNTGGDMEFSRVIWPDYISVGGNLAGFGFSIGVGVIVDRNWNVYLTGAGSEDPAAMVKATKPSASAQLVIGYYRPDGVEPTSPDKLKDFVGGSAIAYGVGFGPYIGASSAQSGTGMEFGAGAGLNLSSSRSWLLIEPANPTEQVHWSVFNDMWKQATTCPIERARDLGYDVYIDHTTGSMFISDHARENERGHIKLAYRLQSGEIYWMDQGSGVNGR